MVSARDLRDEEVAVVVVGVNSLGLVRVDGGKDKREISLLLRCSTAAVRFSLQ